MPHAHLRRYSYRRWRPSARRRSSAAISGGQRVFIPFGRPAPARRPPRPLPIPSPMVLTSALKIYQRLLDHPIARVKSAANLPLVGPYRAGRITDQVTITMDLTATSLAATGVGPVPGYALDGVDLLLVLTGRAAELGLALLASIGRKIFLAAHWACESCSASAIPPSLTAVGSGFC